jgi:hypothetical protein
VSIPRLRVRAVDGAQKLIERLGVAAELPFPIHAHMRATLLDMSYASGLGPSLDRVTVVYTAVADKRIRNIWGK